MAKNTKKEITHTLLPEIALNDKKKLYTVNANDCLIIKLKTKSTGFNRFYETD